MHTLTLTQTARALAKLWTAECRESSVIQHADAKFDGGEFSSVHHGIKEGERYEALLEHFADRTGFSTNQISNEVHRMDHEYVYQLHETGAKYLISYCRADGSTPSWQKLYTYIRATSYQDAMDKFYHRFPDYEVCGWGVLRSIERFCRKFPNNAQHLLPPNHPFNQH